MESLSDVLKSLPVGEMLKQSASQRQTLLNDPLVKKWRIRYPELQDHHFALYLNRLYQYVKEYRNCSSCPGLEACPNDMQGHYTRLEVEPLQGEPQIIDRKVSCKKWVSKQQEDEMRKRIRSFYMDEGALVRGYQIEEIMKIDRKRIKAVEHIEDYLHETKTNGLQTRGLYLAGALGTGKTFLMCYLLHELAACGYSGIIVYMPDFIEDVKSMIQEPAKLKETIELLKETDLLVFDDIGAEQLTPWVRDHVVATILNYRMNRKPTFYTSNYDLNAMEKHFSFTNKDGEEEHKGQRLMDRIRHFVDVVTVEGYNKRAGMPTTG
ncbi:primosomal protein DnaI [Xylanibacillus composti]|uniref:Primosomal protein DnaI n=1 Tax=Xylanibacillus composti TaxID=1572762 RepID=A0A8J4M1E1_9BACL|nr:primosomal protein DnaI [Xylanibacillus composti]MDT9723499.1 primosomal protein DnaI [Xylanibacillus composti]GIQ68464.1 primosomal protein DnaI [Xylanibacillus composti]